MRLAVLEHGQAVQEEALYTQLSGHELLFIIAVVSRSWMTTACFMTTEATAHLSVLLSEQLGVSTRRMAKRSTMRSRFMSL